MPSPSKRSKAAKKGWRTRRRNFKKRSDAAKKGWRTRRRKQEYVINVEYTVSKDNKVEVQILVKGPKRRSRTQVVKALEKRIKTGKSPKGWTIRVVEWKSARKKYKGDNSKATWRSVEFLLGGSNTTVSRKKRGRN